MNRIIILYPKLFKSYDKFSRKILKITQNIESFSIICPDDPNNFIKRLRSKNDINTEIHIDENWKESEVTHGIVFDDGEEFPIETKFLKSKSIPLRIITIAITRVINIKKETKYRNVKSTPTYQYIGRGSYWGNPYSMNEGGDGREEVIRKYKYDFDFETFPNKDKSEVYKLSGKRLGCFCKPEACHGDILADFLNSLDDGK
ncbi:DUF4326 domain-containing protein [Desulfobacula sp.]|uniref:DUF4326 domain-containing protein n=1 Tax=Desulfobacula sp. TaxID=2593537 RepID=UPI0026128012|nr:DUF4326 domain-containing protein [Desulfobacula sp.]